MDFFLSLIFEPLKRFLSEQGIWEPLVELWATIGVLFDTLTGWLGVEAPQGGLVEFLLGALKLSFNILVTIIKVLIDIVNWVIGLF